MNEINFEIQDIEKINLSMDVGIKEIYPPIENLEVTPTKEQQVFNHENSYGYDNVTVNPIPEEYIIPDGTLEVAENGDVDVTNFKLARVGVYTPPNLQDKIITITESGIQNITADEGYDGLNSVKIISSDIEQIVSDELPSEYTRLQYLKSTGKQYIDTRLIPTNNTGFKLKFSTENKNTNSTGSFGTMFGVRYNYAKNGFQLSTFSLGGWGVLNGSFFYGTDFVDDTSARYDPYFYEPNTIQTVSLRDGIFTRATGEEINVLPPDLVINESLLLYALKETSRDVVDEKAKMSLYECEFYEGDRVIRHFIPAKRNSDSEYGLYCTITKQFYTNSGSGSFSGVEI